MISGTPNSAARNFESGSLLHNLLSSGYQVKMTRRRKLKRKSYFVDERALSRAKKVLGVKPEAEVIQRVAEMEEFWEFMKKTHRSVRLGSVEKS
jgi:hypothetical protein